MNKLIHLGKLGRFIFTNKFHKINLYHTDILKNIHISSNQEEDIQNQKENIKKQEDIQEKEKKEDIYHKNKKEYKKNDDDDDNDIFMDGIDLPEELYVTGYL
jgi:hypothetical protein